MLRRVVEPVKEVRTTPSEPVVQVVVANQRRLVNCAEAGRLLQVTTPDNRFQVCRLLEKRAPTLAQEDVVRRVDEELLGSHFENLVSKHIVWLLKPGSSS